MTGQQHQQAKSDPVPGERGKARAADIGDEQLDHRQRDHEGNEEAQRDQPPADRPGAEDDEPPRQFGQREHGLIGQEPRLGEPGNFRHGRSAAGGDDGSDRYAELDNDPVDNSVNLMIRDVANVRETVSMEQIDRIASQRYVSVTANVEGVSMGTASGYVAQAIIALARQHDIEIREEDIIQRLQFIAKILPYYKSSGASRQIFHTQWGGFDTHANQRNTTNTSGNLDLDTQLAQLAGAMVAFDQAMSAAGMGREVAVLVMSEFSRTLDPASGNGSDHAWGGHWMLMGQSVGGGKLYGAKFPSLVLGGADDAHNGKRGYFVPQWSSDQVAADLLTWLGLPAEALGTVLPNLANFSQKTVGVMNA